MFSRASSSPRVTVSLVALTVVLSWTAALAAQGANLVLNGSFEDGDCSGDFHLVAAGDSSTIPNWEVYVGDVHWSCNNNFWESFDGLGDIDLDGSTGSNGGIRQTIPTQAGSTYRVTFRMAGNNFNTPEIKTMDVSVAGVTESFQFDTTGILAGALQLSNWETHTMTFVASSATSTLSFLSTTSPAGWGALVDDVSVEEVSPSGVPAMSGWGIVFLVLALGAAGIADTSIPIGVNRQPWFAAGSGVRG